MRNIFFLLLVMLTAVSAKADAWDNLTHEQATKVVHFLEKNRFIIDYCDCCGAGEPSYLIKVESAEIVPCEWDKKKFSVLVKGRRITKFQVNAHGIDDYHTDALNEEVAYTVFMNYTFGFDHHMKWAVPLHKLVDYANNGPICFGATIYPNPEDKGVKITDVDYITWYKKHITG
jgi:hypothetical protein